MRSTSDGSCINGFHSFHPLRYGDLMDKKPKQVNPSLNRAYNHIPVLIDRCPHCKLKFSKRKVKILYKEFCECMDCGGNFMAADIDEIYRYL